MSRGYSSGLLVGGTAVALDLAAPTLGLQARLHLGPGRTRRAAATWRRGGRLDQKRDQSSLRRATVVQLRSVLGRGDGEYAIDQTSGQPFQCALLERFRQRRTPGQVPAQLHP